MTKETAISICEALYHHLQPYDEQPKEAFRMAVDALEGQLEQPKIVRCKDCKRHYNELKCRCGGYLPGDWFCADGEKRSD